MDEDSYVDRLSLGLGGPLAHMRRPARAWVLIGLLTAVAMLLVQVERSLQSGNPVSALVQFFAILAAGAYGTSLILAERVEQ